MHLTYLSVFPTAIVLVISLLKLDLSSRKVNEVINYHHLSQCTKKLNFSVKYYVNKLEKILRKLHICSHLLVKPLMENIVLCVVSRVDS